MTPERYRVVVDAAQLSEENGEDLAKWCHGGVYGASTDDRCVIFETWDGTDRAEIGDWIVTFGAQTFWRVEPEAFEGHYEKVEGEQ